MNTVYWLSLSLSLSFSREIQTSITSKTTTDQGDRFEDAWEVFDSMSACDSLYPQLQLTATLCTWQFRRSIWDCIQLHHKRVHAFKSRQANCVRTLSEKNEFSHHLYPLFNKGHTIIQLWVEWSVHFLRWFYARLAQSYGVTCETFWSLSIQNVRSSATSWEGRFL
jgi:hypothetical protein